MNLKFFLESLDACSMALQWSENREVNESAWLACSRGEWLLWFAEKIGIDKNLIILAVCDCADSVIHLFPENEKHLKNAIKTMRALAVGQVTKKELHHEYGTALVDTRLGINIKYRNAAQISTNIIGIVTHNISPWMALRSIVFTTKMKEKNIADIIRKRIPWSLWEGQIVLFNDEGFKPPKEIDEEVSVKYWIMAAILLATIFLSIVLILK